MPFFPQALFTPAQADQTFGNIFQLINDIDSYQRDGAERYCKPAPQKQQQKPAAAPKAQRNSYHHTTAANANPLNSLFGISRPFSPRFDVRETESTYELHGELAGVDRNNVTLEFTEPQTLVISGKVERNYSSKNNSGTSGTATPAVEATPDAVADTHSESSDSNILAGGARTPVDEDEPFTEINAPRSPSPARSHRATVTDEATEEALERGQAASTEVAPTSPRSAPPAERFWVQERAIGEFKRVFNFPVPVDETSVRASLENGILSVSVPKTKREARRIVIS